MRIPNKRASHDYFLLERYEAGIALTGAEVKSLRLGRATLSESFVRAQTDGLYLINCHIPPFKGSEANVDPNRSRQLLLHKKEILKLAQKDTEKQMVIVPTAIYFKNNRAKVEIALAKPKKMADKRQTLKNATIQRDIDRQIKTKI